MLSIGNRNSLQECNLFIVLSAGQNLLPSYSGKNEEGLSLLYFNFSYMRTDENLQILMPILIPLPHLEQTSKKRSYFCNQHLHKKAMT